MANNGIITSYDDEGYPVNPVFTAPSAAAASAVIKGSPGSSWPRSSSPLRAPARTT